MSHVNGLAELLRVVLTGTTNTLWSQRVSSLGAPAQASFIVTLCKYFAQVMASLFAARFLNLGPDGSAAKPVPPETRRLVRPYLLCISCFDVMSTVSFFLAISMIGSGLYQVINSFQLVSTALISRIFLRRTLTTGQWLGICVITAGMTVSAPSSSSPDSEQEVSRQLAGLACSIAHALLGSGSGIMSALLQRTLRAKGLPDLPDGYISGRIGRFSLLLSLAYFVIYTLPRWEELVLLPMAAHGVDAASLVAALTIYLGTSSVHSFTYWSVLTKLGPVMIGLSNAMRTVLVFFLSAFFFCSSNEAQCLTPAKITSAFIVVTGVVIFVMSVPSSKAGKKDD